MTTLSGAPEPEKPKFALGDTSFVFALFAEAGKHLKYPQIRLVHHRTDQLLTMWVTGRSWRPPLQRRSRQR